MKKVLVGIAAGLLSTMGAVAALAQDADRPNSGYGIGTTVDGYDDYDVFSFFFRNQIGGGNFGWEFQALAGSFNLEGVEAVNEALALGAFANYRVPVGQRLELFGLAGAQYTRVTVTDGITTVGVDDTNFGAGVAAEFSFRPGGNSIRLQHIAYDESFLDATQVFYVFKF